MKKITCPNCKGKGTIVTLISGDRVYQTEEVCFQCKGTREIEEQETVKKGKKRQTNDQWFSSLNTFEKAKWFCDHITCSDGCPFYKQCLDEDMGYKLWQKWLLEEHS